MPSSPLSPSMLVLAGTVAHESGCSPPPGPSWTMRTRPGRSVTKSLPSGARSTAHGARSPDATRGRAKRTPALLTLRPRDSTLARNAPGSHARRSPSTELRRRHRRRDEVALRTRESELDDAVPRRLVFDADGDRLDAAAARRAD